MTGAVWRVTKSPLSLSSLRTLPISPGSRNHECAGADAISLINTLLGMRIDIKKDLPLPIKRAVFQAGLFSRSLCMVYQVYEAVRIPIIGMGGVAGTEDVSR